MAVSRLFYFCSQRKFSLWILQSLKNNYEDSSYCSVELIYAMCAVGSRLTPDLQEYSEVYYQRSKKTLLQLVFDEQSTARITTVQALFCLAFYELGKGNNQLGGTSRAWLSGSATTWDFNWTLKSGTLMITICS